ncbi:MAG: OmpA family protein [Pseudomonadota bacterium]
MSENRNEPSRKSPRFWIRSDSDDAVTLDRNIGLAALLLAAFFILGAFTIPTEIERDVTAAVEESLRKAGLADLDVRTEGQTVFLSGQLQGENLNLEIAKIQTVARGASCDTWLISDFVCPQKVVVSVTQTPPKVPTETLASSPAVTAEVATSVGSPNDNFSIEKTADLLVLRGDFPSAKLRDMVLRHATNSGLAVIDEMLINGAPTPAYFPWAVERALSIMALLELGEISWREEKFSVVGRITSDNEQAINAAFKSDVFSDQLAALKLDVRPVYNDAATCNRAFAEVFAHENVEFAPQSDKILATSTSLLDRLAVLTEQCTLRFDIENHTDASTDKNDDIELSEQRAQAVVQALVARGIAAERLHPKGVGPAAIENKKVTPIERMQNRRTIIVAKQ